MACRTGYKRVIGDEVSVRHFIEQVIRFIEKTHFGIHRDERVPRVCGLIGKIIESLLGTLYTAALGIHINETVGEKSVEKKRGFYEVTVQGLAKLETFCCDAIGNQGRVLLFSGGSNYFEIISDWIPLGRQWMCIMAIEI
ncbi:hypothetical protein AAHE18_13G340000 [Arachis hypogaea]